MNTYHLHRRGSHGLGDCSDLRSIAESAGCALSVIQGRQELDISADVQTLRTAQDSIRCSSSLAAVTIPNGIGTLDCVVKNENAKQYVLICAHLLASKLGIEGNPLHTLGKMPYTPQQLIKFSSLIPSGFEVGVLGRGVHAFRSISGAAKF